MKYLFSLITLFFTLNVLAQHNYGDLESNNKYRYVNKSSPQYLSCVQQHLNAYYPKNISETLCERYEERQQLVLNSKFHECVDYFKNLSVANGGDESAALFCFYLDFKKFSILNFDEKCLSLTLATPTALFWTYEDYTIIREQSRNDNIFIEVIKNCQLNLRNNPEVQEKNRFFKLNSRTVYHTSVTNNPDFKNLSGLSGITYNKKDQYLVTVSDEKYNSGLNYFNIVNRQTLIYPFSIDHIKSRPMNYSLSDVEDIVMNASGNYIITREEIFEDQFKKTHKNSDESPSYIVEINQNRSLERHIPLPAEFFKSIVEQEYDCPEGFFSGIAKAFSSLFGNNKKEAEPKKCVAKKSVNGIKYNRGIEALAIDENKNLLFYAPEQPLNKPNENLADGKNNYLVPIYAHDLSTNEYTKYQYLIEQKFDNGLVAMTHYKNMTLITLERSYDPNKKEAEVKLYRIDLSAHQENEVVQKKLLLNLHELKNDLAFGFKKIDNFEGMTFGPVLPNGHKSLILVSDNNNSLKQKTDFLVLELVNEF